MKGEGAISEGYFYKYRTTSNKQFLREIFVEHKLYFARPSDFNDPFDCRFSNEFKGTQSEMDAYINRTTKDKLKRLGLPRSERRGLRKEYRASLRGKNKKIETEIEERLVSWIETFGVLSLSKAPDEILMWSHYADCHRGICLEFLDDPNDRFFGKALPVDYSEHYPVINHVKDNNDQRLRKSLLTKAKRWEYEKEHRIIHNLIEGEPTGRGARVFPKDQMTGVIFGCNAPETTVSEVRSLSKEGNLDVKFYRAERHPASYALNIVKMD